MGELRFKTLVLNKGTKYQEFYGHMDGYGWVTSQSPIHTMNKSVTWDDVKRHFPSENFNGVDLVTIEINILD